MNKPTSMPNARAIWKPRACAKNNGDFISIESYSAYSYLMADPKTPEHILSPDAPDEILGKAVLEALQCSRFLSEEEDLSLYLTMEQRYAEWVKKTMDRFGYRNKNALFRKMKHCDIQSKDGLIVLEPSHHAKLELWTGDFIKREDYVKVPADGSLPEIGAALRLAFTRCKGMGAEIES
jgi:contact-dependent growth inhibition (CDI) system CdiI-like immunity protein